MTKTFEDIAVSKILREHIARRFPNRGRFKELEQLSGVPEWKWKNFFYERQAAAVDQLSFWKSTYPGDAFDVVTEADIMMNLRHRFTMNEELMQAFVEFNEAAASISYCQIANISTTAERLEAARRAFYDLFLRAAKRD